MKKKTNRQENLILQKITDFQLAENMDKLVPVALTKAKLLVDKGKSSPGSSSASFYKDAKFWAINFYKPISKIFIA